MRVLTTSEQLQFREAFACDAPRGRTRGYSSRPTPSLLRLARATDYWPSGVQGTGRRRASHSAAGMIMFG